MLADQPPNSVAPREPKLPDVLLPSNDVSVEYPFARFTSDTPHPSPSAFEIAFVRRAVALGKSILQNSRVIEAVKGIAPESPLSDRLSAYLSDASAPLPVKLRTSLRPEVFILIREEGGDKRVMHLNYNASPCTSRYPPC